MGKILKKIQEWWSDLEIERQIALSLLGGGITLLEICLVVAFGVGPVFGGTVITLAVLAIFVGLVGLMP